MVSKQLKIWSRDFQRYYDKTSLMMRIVIGAFLSFLIAQTLTNRMIKAQNKELKELKKKYDAMEVIDDENLIIADLKNTQRKLSNQVESIRKVNCDLTLVCGNLTKNDTGKSLLELRSLIDKNTLRIISEERLIEKTATTSRRRSANATKVNDTRVKIAFPSFLQCDGYTFELLGSFQDIRQFLLEAYGSDSLFFINNIKINQSKELLTDQNLNQYQALRCAFEVHIPYQVSAGLTTGKK